MCSSTFQSNVFQNGGYDYQFVDGPLFDDYTCLVCTLVAKEAQQTTCCGRVFCKQCLERMATKSYKCLKCEDQEGKYFPDKRAIHSIDQLKVYCTNKEGGCRWEGELRHAEIHLESCPYRLAKCPNQCTEVVKGTDLAHHLETLCPNREVECSLCKQIGKHAHISTDHLEKCPNVEIDCPNKDCQETPKRKDMEAHRQQCPKETVSCQYADLGCEYVCLREDIADHDEKQMPRHLILVLDELRTTRMLLKRETKAMQAQVVKMTNFSKLKRKQEAWYSPPFYTFPGGYKMCLRVDAGGAKDGKGTHISAFLYLMAGENDEILEWPMRGIFSIELLNQEEDQNHKEYSVKYVDTKDENWNSRVSKGYAPTGIGRHRLIEHQELESQFLPSQTQYLKKDNLYFRVTMTEKLSGSKPWLAGAIS